MKNRLARIIDIVTPRFISEDVALIDVGDQYEPVCSMNDIHDGERFDAIATFRSFNLFGLAIFPKMIGKVRPYPH